MRKTQQEFFDRINNLPSVEVEFFMLHPLRKNKEPKARIKVDQLEVIFDLTEDLWNLVTLEEEVDPNHKFKAKKKIRFLKGPKKGGYGLTEFYRVDLQITREPLIVISKFLNDYKIIFVQKKVELNSLFKEENK